MTDLTLLTVYIAITIYLAALGACFGSFINAASLRYAAGQDFVKGRSVCPGCKVVLCWYDLIPMASFIILKGRCRYCKSKIPARYVLIELLAAIAFPLCFAVLGMIWFTIAALAVTCILLAISLIDLATSEIPDGLIIALIPIAIVSIWLMPEIGVLSRLIGMVAISLPMLILTLIISGAFGGGDIKLMAVCGFMLGLQNTLLAFFIALLLGGGRAVYLMAAKNRKYKKHMVFGPALSAGIFISILFGEDIIHWYLSFFGL